MEIFAAVDIETTGLDVGRHEILDIAIVPLNSDFTIDVGMPDFSVRIRAEHPETAELQALRVNGLNPRVGLSASEAAADFRQWLVDCCIDKVIPVAHNLEFDMKFIRRTFPVESKVFSHHGRDSCGQRHCSTGEWRGQISKRIPEGIERRSECRRGRDASCRRRRPGCRDRLSPVDRNVDAGITSKKCQKRSCGSLNFYT